MPRSRPPYPREFRKEAVRLVRSSGRPIAQITRELGIARGTLSAWVKQAELGAGLRSDGLTTAEREEWRRLRRENRILPEEREILKKSGRLLRSGDRVQVVEAFGFVEQERAIIGWPGCAGCWASPPAGTTRGASAD